MYTSVCREKNAITFRPSRCTNEKLLLRDSHYRKLQTICPRQARAKEWSFTANGLETIWKRLESYGWFNLLRWNDVPRTLRMFFVAKLQYFLSFKYVWMQFGQNKRQVCCFLIISIQWCHTDEFDRERKRRIIVHGSSVTRYGPRSSCQRKGLKY